MSRWRWCRATLGWSENVVATSPAVTPGAARTWRKMSRRVGSPNAAATAATAALNRPSAAPAGRSVSAVIGAVLTLGSLPRDQSLQLGRRERRPRRRGLPDPTRDEGVHGSKPITAGGRNRRGAGSRDRPDDR